MSIAPKTLRRTVALWATVACLIAAGSAHADGRRFAWNYSAAAAPKGSREYEQWVTWKTNKPGDDRYERLEFRHELEFGLTDRLRLGVYVADWRYTRTSGGSNTEVRTSGAEFIWAMTDPYTSAIGSALYGEFAIGQEKLKLEAKLLLEKPFGPLVAVANTVIEAEWEDENWSEDIGKFEQTLGLSWQMSPGFMLGAEGVLEKEFPGWSDGEPTVVHAGPNVSYRNSSWWVTTSPLMQLSNLPGEPDLMWRTLVGVPF